MYKADLHIHSTISDGSDDMHAIFAAAAACDLTHIALTEHDTAAGLAQASALSSEFGVELVPGVEFSAFDYTYGIRAHILGYGIRDPEPVERLGGPLLMRRHKNSLRQIEVLRSLGYDINADEVAKKAGRYIYKQHIMHVMVEKGYAESIGGATYRRLFKNGGPCAFDIEYIDASDAIRTVLDAGGIPCLAHPGQQDNFHIVPGLVEEGLMGLELHHHSNNAYHQIKASALAAKYGLLLTGGSDHHGLYEENSPAVGAYLCPGESFEKLLEICR